MTHTPAPWRIDAEHDDTRIEIVGRPTWGCTRYGVKGEWGVATIDLDDGEDAEANARLIAAAPDLLEALEGAIGALEQDLDAGKDSGDADWEGLAYQRLEAARAAIAKARTP